MELSATELIDAAKQIEAAGEAFYEAALPVLKGAAVREVFQWLRAEEGRHAEAFEALLDALAQGDAAWRGDEQYQGHLRALIEGHVFPSPARAREAAAGLTTDAQAIELALGFERDTIRTLEAFRSRVRRTDRAMVDTLIEEERGHIEALEELAARRAP